MRGSGFYRQVCGRRPGISPLQCSCTHLERSVHLRREFENFSPALKTVASRLSRGAYKCGERPAEPSITDDRGRLIRSVGKTQTFLSAAQVDELVALHVEGLNVTELSRKLGIHPRTAAAHLVRRSVPLRQRGLATDDTPEAVRLYESGLTLVEVGLRFGASQQAVRYAITKRGVVIRARGRRPVRHLEPDRNRPREERDPTPKAPGGMRRIWYVAPTLTTAPVF